MSIGSRRKESEISGICLFLVTHLNHELTRAAHELRVWVRARAQLKTLSSLLKRDQCDAGFVGFTTRHLYQRIQEHRYSAGGKHLSNISGSSDTSNLSSNFSIFKKCQTKFDCLLYEMFFIKELKAMLHETIFLATRIATNVSLQVARKKIHV